MKQPRPSPAPRKKGALVSDIVWGVATLMVVTYAFFCLHQGLFMENGRAGIVAIFLLMLALALATQAPVKE